MEQRKTNQERARKSTKSSSFTDAGEPSRAPRQDENGRDRVGSTFTPQVDYAQDSERQGVSNRPTKDEHAFPASGTEEPTQEPDESVETTPKQLGGNRGGV